MMNVHMTGDSDTLSDENQAVNLGEDFNNFNHNASK
jgi:hypothetical protein